VDLRCSYALLDVVILILKCAQKTQSCFIGMQF
jgi:hypothetical protein